MLLRNRLTVAGVVALTLLAPAVRAEDNAAERQSVEEVRNTVINLLQALVQKGLLTREQAEQMVKQAQEKASVDAAAAAAKNAARAKEEENAVRVPYVPQIVKDEISKQVAEQVKPAVVESVVKEAKEEKWGVPGALPDWITRVRVFGDVVVRYQADRYPSDNGQILDFNAINQAGGFSKTPYPYLDTTDNRNRLRVRARFGAESDLGDGFSTGIRLSSGSLTDPSSESQTLGQYGQRWTVGVDQAFVRWDSSPKNTLPWMSIAGGRIGNPWFAPTELVYSRDLTFEGVADTLRVGWGPGGADRSNVFLTFGGFPILEIPLVNKDNKWLVGGQFGTKLRWGTDGRDRFTLAGAYYDFLHVTGVLNDPNAPGLTNYTAPAFIRYGNSVFDIANDPTGVTNLFALAAHFRLADIAASYQLDFGRHMLAITGDAVRNVGYNLAEVEALSGQTWKSSQNKGYVAEISFGNPVVERFAQWRVAVGYRYVERDAVIDAWTDADFHEGGTNARGYTVWTQFGLTRNTWVRLRYLSGNEIDGPPRYGVDILQLDVNARF